MQINEISSVDNPNFVSDFLGKLTPGDQTQITPPSDSTEPVQQFLQTNTKTDAQTVEKAGDAPVDPKDPQEFLKDIKKEEEAPAIPDLKKLSETLAEKQLLYKFEDGTLPENEEEFFQALEQSVQTKAQQTVQGLWQEKLNSYSPQVQTVLRYAEMGGTTASELSKLVNQVSQYEAIAQLDPKRPEDQEQIVYTQLVNSGMSDKMARTSIADFKALNKLDQMAEEFFPSIKKGYEAQVNQTYQEKQRAIEEEDRYVKTNATNVDYFLKNEEQFLPFKIANNSVKNTIFQLAAQPVEYTETGEAVFGWQKYIQSLQMGDEKAYKQYMKIMTFAANIEAYDKSVSKNSATQTTEKNFKKIMTTEGKSNNSTGQQQDYTPAPTIQKSTGAWSA